MIKRVEIKISHSYKIEDEINSFLELNQVNSNSIINIIERVEWETYIIIIFYRI